MVDSFLSLSRFCQDYTKEQIEKIIIYLSNKPLKWLRKCQRINIAQQILYYNRRNECVWDENVVISLQSYEKLLIEAIDRKEFLNEQ